MKPKMQLRLERQLTSDTGTFGCMTGPGLSLCTVELPWRGNKTGVSCIPEGTYVCVPHSSTRYARAFRLLNVPGREGILIHAGNNAGDKAKGFRSDSTGCILVGRKFGPVYAQDGVQESALAMGDLLLWAGNEPFGLLITEAALAGKHGSE